MLKLGGALLIAVVISSAALAQGFGIGVGIDDLRRMGLAAAAPPTPPVTSPADFELTIMNNVLTILN